MVRICGSKPPYRSTARCERPLSRNHQMCIGKTRGGKKSGWVNPNYVKSPKQLWRLIDTKTTDEEKHELLALLLQWRDENSTECVSSLSLF